MKDPGNITNAEWVRAHFEVADIKPPKGSMTQEEIAELIGFARSSVVRIIAEKVRKGELIEYKCLVRGHWKKFYLPAKNDKAKGHKDRRAKART